MSLPTRHSKLLCYTILLKCLTGWSGLVSSGGASWSVERLHTAVALFSSSVHSLTLAFFLISAITCSYTPRMCSSPVIPVSCILEGSINPNEPLLTVGLIAVWFCEWVLGYTSSWHTTQFCCFVVHVCLKTLTCNTKATIELQSTYLVTCKYASDFVVIYSQCACMCSEGRVIAVCVGTQIWEN